MGNRQRYAKFQENLFRSNEIISIFCPPLFRKQPIYAKNGIINKLSLTDFLIALRTNAVLFVMSLGRAMGVVF